LLRGGGGCDVGAGGLLLAFDGLGKFQGTIDAPEPAIPEAPELTEAAVVLAAMSA
jgi:hypothetical protein